MSKDNQADLEDADNPSADADESAGHDGGEGALDEDDEDEESEELVEAIKSGAVAKTLILLKRGAKVDTRLFWGEVCAHSVRKQVALTVAIHHGSG